jgi:hypothetical protein
VYELMQGDSHIYVYIYKYLYTGTYIRIHIYGEPWANVDGLATFSRCLNANKGYRVIKGVTHTLYILVTHAKGRAWVPCASSHAKCCMVGIGNGQAILSDW